MLNALRLLVAYIKAWYSKTAIEDFVFSFGLSGVLNGFHIFYVMNKRVPG